MRDCTLRSPVVSRTRVPLSFESNSLIAGNVKFSRVSAANLSPIHPRKPYEIWRVDQLGLVIRPIIASHGLLLAAKTYTQLLHFILFRSPVSFRRSPALLLLLVYCSVVVAVATAIAHSVGRSYARIVRGCAELQQPTLKQLWWSFRNAEKCKNRAARRVFRRFLSRRARLFPPNVPCACVWVFTSSCVNCQLWQRSCVTVKLCVDTLWICGEFREEDRDTRAPPAIAVVVYVCSGEYPFNPPLSFTHTSVQCVYVCARSLLDQHDVRSMRTPHCCVVNSKHTRSHIRVLVLPLCAPLNW